MATKNYLVLNGHTAKNTDTSEGADAVIVLNRGDVVALSDEDAIVELQRNRIVEADDATVAAVQAEVRGTPGFEGEDHAFRSVE